MDWCCGRSDSRSRSRRTSRSLHGRGGRARRRARSTTAACGGSRGTPTLRARSCFGGGFSGWNVLPVPRDDPRCRADVVPVSVTPARATPLTSALCIAPATHRVTAAPARHAQIASVLGPVFITLLLMFVSGIPLVRNAVSLVSCLAGPFHFSPLTGFSPPAPRRRAGRKADREALLPPLARAPPDGRRQVGRVQGDASPPC